MKNNKKLVPGRLYTKEEMQERSKFLIKSIKSGRLQKSIDEATKHLPTSEKDLTLFFLINTINMHTAAINGLIDKLEKAKILKPAKPIIYDPNAN